MNPIKKTVHVDEAATAKVEMLIAALERGETKFQGELICETANRLLCEYYSKEYGSNVIPLTAALFIKKGKNRR